MVLSVARFVYLQVQNQLHIINNVEKKWQSFWDKNKSQNLVKQVSKLKAINYFNGLGSYFDKIQRMRKLGGMISDELLISKDQVELSASICKVDLLSDLVGEFPELQGIMGGYFAEVQGFNKDISIAVSEHYFPTLKRLFLLSLGQIKSHQL